MITVVNQSTLVSAVDARLMTRACAAQIRRHAAPAWGLLPVPVVYASSAEDAPPGAWVISILDDPDQADALGWHTEDQGEHVYGRAFARPVLDNGGTVLSGGLSVSSVLSHEVLETLIDPRCNLWADRGDGTIVALEVADPVEADSYTITVGGTAVSVSSFALPDWFDPQAGGPYDWMGRTSQPFEVTAGGYVVQAHEGHVSAVFGAEYPSWRRKLKGDPSRSARRFPV